MLLSGIMYGRQQSNIIDTGIFLNIKCKENRRWSGLMMDFKRYRESLKNTPEPKADKLYPIDYKGIIQYAKKQGKYPSELTDEEKRKFILQ